MFCYLHLSWYICWLSFKLDYLWAQFVAHSALSFLFEFNFCFVLCLTDFLVLTINPLTPRAFWGKMDFFSLHMNQNCSIQSSQKGICNMTACLSLHLLCILWHFYLGMHRNPNFKISPFLLLFFLSFCCSFCPSSGLASSSSEKIIQLISFTTSVEID